MSPRTRRSRDSSSRDGVPTVDAAGGAGATGEPPSTLRLASGALAQFQRDGSTRTLVVDGTPQSAVVLDDPTRLEFGYIRHMGHVLDLAFPTGRPVTAVHLGAGALTIPRYLEATRPGSRQQVVELERELIDFVRAHAPLPRSASIRIRYGDAREQLARLPEGLLGSVDAVVVDIFAGARTPAHVTSREFYGVIAPFLAPGGVVLVNVADGHELRFARGQASTLLDAFEDVALVADPTVVKGRRFGNITAVASDRALDLDGLERLVASGFPPARVLRGVEVRSFARGAAVVHDDDATPSPLPGRAMFAQRRTSTW